jgi:uncharacterized protein (DUF2336 family)
LARDVEEVALPVLSASSVLSDEDLIAIARDRDAAKQAAIAHRPTISAKLAATLVEVGDENTLATLVANEGAELGEHSLNRVIDRFGDKPAVQQPLVKRAKLPMAISERLVFRP